MLDVISFVVQRPSQGLVSLEQSKSWLGLAGTTENDDIINEVLLEASDYICGPSSQTGICFREWELKDIRKSINRFFVESVNLKYAVLKELVEIRVDGEIIPEANYEVINLQYKQSIIDFVSSLSTKNLEIQYITGAEKVPRQIILGAKMALFSFFENRGIESEITLKENPAFDRLLAPYVL